MGRELRRVPATWDHPRDKSGHYVPLHDRDYDTVAEAWVRGCIAWANGTHPALREYPDRAKRDRYYWEWEGDPPNQTYYRPKWTEAERTHYQVYENVTEGTPLSPVFATEEEVVAWLVREWHCSEAAARQFCRQGHVASFAWGAATGQLLVGIETLEPGALPQEDDDGQDA